MSGFGEMKKVCCLVVIVAMAAVAVDVAESAITCGDVLRNVNPCLGYLQRGGEVAAPCCDGVKSLNQEAATTPDRQAVCGCIKSLAPSVGAKADNINSLPGKCGVPLPYRYSPSMDCSKVK